MVDVQVLRYGVRTESGTEAGKKDWTEPCARTSVKKAERKRSGRVHSVAGSMGVERGAYSAERGKNERKEAWGRGRRRGLGWRRGERAQTRATVTQTQARSATERGAEPG